MTEALRTDPRPADGASLLWFVRWVQASPLSPVWTAVCIATGLTLAEFAVAGLSGGALPIDPLFVSRALGTGLMIGYLFWAAHFLTIGTLRDLAALRPVLRGGADAHDRIVHRIVCFRPHEVALSTLVAFAFAAISVELVNGSIQRLLGGGPASAMGVFLIVNNLLVWLLAGPVLYSGFTGALRLGRMGGREVVVDLLDLRPLAPFARYGLRVAFIALTALALYVAVVALRGTSRLNFLLSAWNILYLSPIVVLAVLALVAPSRGVHRQIRAAKRAELQRVQEAIAGGRNALAHSPLAREDREISLVDLVTWRNAVAQIREWPFDSAALGRFGLYLLIPVASWVGGALVERFVNAVLD